MQNKASEQDSNNETDSPLQLQDLKQINSLSL